MATKLLNENQPYKNHYHFIASTKYRKNAFMEEHSQKTERDHRVCGSRYGRYYAY